MRLVGYGDKLSVEQGGRIEFMVSSQQPRYAAHVVRLFHTDANPAGPGFKSEPVDSELAGEYPGHHQRLRCGSYVCIPTGATFPVEQSFTVQAWIWPATPLKAAQTLVSRRSADDCGFALRLSEGRLALCVGDAELTLDTPVVERTWYAVTASYDAERGEGRIRAEPAAATAGELRGVVAGPLRGEVATDAPELLIGAEAVVEDGDASVGGFYNGKLDAPRLFARALADAERLDARAASQPSRDGLVGWWDFARDVASRAVTDVSGNGWHGRTVQKPTRGVTGWNWDGSQTAWPAAPHHYGAIHFHDDDLDDAGWERSFGWTVPDDQPSGVYAVHLAAGEEEDHVPFVVRPKRGRPTARIAFLLPTFSYLAYANQHLLEGKRETFQALGIEGEAVARYPSTPHDRYILDNRLNSLYDAHSDGSGVCYSSRLRPLVNMHPKYRSPMLNDGEGSPHQLNADLHIVDWLHEHGYEVDVLTDEDLHVEGASLLAPYRVILTGSHHEYWSEQMIDATQEHLCDGGRLMYLAGNGMYWVTQHDPDTGAGIEIRRAGPSTRTWETEPGEEHLSATGELGGIWRFRGRAPQTWLGVGFTSQGLGAGRPYERKPDSYDARAAWVFEGVDPDKPIGDFPSLVNGYGAAGLEIDRCDPELGTPRRTLWLASATGFSDSYQHAVEEVPLSTSLQGGSVEPRVRADMTLLEYPNGGAVFSTGSIGWSACLSYDGYDNDVSRVTRNVLDRFASDVTSVLDGAAARPRKRGVRS
jgi:N,N-dimethylformamidase